MENYDLLEYEEARKLLNQALTVAKKAKMEREPVTAKVHLSLGIVYFAGLGDAESAKLSFLNAVEIDNNIQLDKSYSTPEMAKLLEDALAQTPVGDGGGGDGGGAPTGPEPMSVDCGTVTGMMHTLIETAAGGTDLTVEAALGADVNAAKVAVMYRPRGASEFTEVAMMLSAGCVYGGQIPASALTGDLIHYYVAAYNAAGKVIASKGSAGLAQHHRGLGRDQRRQRQLRRRRRGSLAGDHSTDGNRNNKPVGGGDTGGAVSGNVRATGKKTLFLAVAGGSGAGYVTGKTEQESNNVKCCFAPQLLHVMPELGGLPVAGDHGLGGGAARLPYWRQHRGPLAGRAGRPHRNRHSLSNTLSGLMVVGGLGGGVVRDTIKLDGAQAGMDTDVVALGPLLVNLGAGHNASLGGGVNLAAESTPWPASRSPASSATRT